MRGLGVVDKVKRVGLVDGAQGPVSIVWGQSPADACGPLEVFAEFYSLSGLLYEHDPIMVIPQTPERSYRQKTAPVRHPCAQGTLNSRIPSPH